FKDLPGGIFNKGFVRAYAKFLGLNEEEMVAEYVKAEAGAEVQPTLTPPIAMETQKLMASMAVAKEREVSVRMHDPAARVLVTLVTIAVVLGVGGYAYKYYEEKNSGTARAAEQSPAQQQHVAPVKAQAPVVTSTSSTQSAVTTTQQAIPNTQPSAATTTPSPDASADPLTGVHIELHARAQSWMQVSADGRVPVEMTLNANQSKKFYAEKQLMMKFGNAEAIEVVRNGKPMPAFAPGTKTQTVTYKSEM
ncbi:MAG TPA: RodZ domain-containing protein, partial [Terriglobales bacterium]|nr:RodZ domain-containing protein [Terriglobales bacterium]